jgi:hypothetical protein
MRQTSEKPEVEAMSITFQLTPEERASFEGNARPISVRGPVTLMRLVGRTAGGRANDPFGRYWFNERYFWKVLDVLTDHHKDVSLVNHYLKFVIREGTAVCHDWNSFAKVYQLRVPAGAELQAYVGRAKPQPFYSAADPLGRKSLPHEFLMGGEVQYVVNVDNVARRYVSGPLPAGIHGIGHA